MERYPSLDQFNKTYAKNNIITIQSNENHTRQLSNEKTSTSIARPNTKHRKQSWQASQTSLSIKQSFRDLVLRATDNNHVLDRRDSTARGHRLAGLGHQARLQKFRQIALRWREKAKMVNTVEPLLETDFEAEIPDKPRFCATLSTEAQYAILKGYEDILVDKISSSLCKNDRCIQIERRPSAEAKPEVLTNCPNIPPLLENKPNIVLNVSSTTATMGDWNDETSDVRLRSNRDQCYMSTHFKQAMNILDELKLHDFQDDTSCSIAEQLKPASVVLVKQNICRQYHAWSEKWAKQFQFSQ